jgi:hypothetical protein
MLFLKACPRCKGDLFQESDRDGPCAVCIQCGCRLTDDQVARVIESGRTVLRPAVVRQHNVEPQRAAA